MESASYVWNLISNNALLATLVATACVGGISALYKSLKHHGLLKLPLVLPDASGENSGKDFLTPCLNRLPECFRWKAGSGNWKNSTASSAMKIGNWASSC